jgi:indolepyruvate ferredoxin oxidoreductase beta subunit
MQAAIREIFSRKGDAVVEMNLKALAAGKETAERKL